VRGLQAHREASNPLTPSLSPAGRGSRARALLYYCTASSPTGLPRASRTLSPPGIFVRTMPVKVWWECRQEGRLGRGWGWGSESVDTSRATTTTPTPALRHSRCFASAFLALRTAAEGRLCVPTRGVKTEFAARRDRTSRAAIATMLSAQFRWIRASRRFSLHESTRKFGNGPLLPVAPLNCCRHLTIYRGGRARRNTPLCKPLPAGPVCA
jgi:hypothetical protein